MNAKLISFSLQLSVSKKEGDPALAHSDLSMCLLSENCKLGVKSEASSAPAKPAQTGFSKRDSEVLTLDRAYK